MFLAGAPTASGGWLHGSWQKRQTTLLKGTENAQDPFFSPDGKWLGFFADYRLKRVSVEGGAPVTVCEAPNDRGASWTDDDTIVLAPHIFGGLVRVQAAGGVPEPLTSLADGEASHAWPQAIAGRQVVLFTGGAADAPNVQVLSLVNPRDESRDRRGLLWPLCSLGTHHLRPQEHAVRRAIRHRHAREPAVCRCRS